MKLNKRKGFTIVELVIVIAVIAILAAVLIPNISNLVKKANASADESLVRNLNTALSMDVEKHQTMDAALEAAKTNGGYDLTTIVTKNKDNKILWDSKNDCFVYMKKGASKPTYLPNTQEVKDVKPYDYFEIVTEKPTDFSKFTTYSIYAAWTAGEGDTVEGLKVGFDAGKNAFASVTYDRSTETTGQSVIIRTNSVSTVLEVNAEKDVVVHYGKANSVNVISVAPSSYHEFGNIVGNISLSNGRVVLENGAKAAAVVINATANDISNGNKVIAVDSTNSSEVAIIVDSDVKNAIESIGGNNKIVATDKNLIVADDNSVAAIGNIKYDSLSGAIDAASNGDVIYLLKDVYFDGVISNGKNISINLNDKTIYTQDQSKTTNTGITIENASVKFCGNGYIRSHEKNRTWNCSLVYINGSVNDTDIDYTYVEFGAGIKFITKNSNSEIKDKEVSKFGCFAYAISPDTAKGVSGSWNTRGITISYAGRILDGWGTSINGLIKNTVNAPTFIFEEGAVVSGIYAAGYANWIINGGTFKENNEFDAGNIVINGGDFVASGEKKCNVTSNEASCAGYALAIVSRKGYSKSVNCTINGGNFNTEIIVVNQTDDTTPILTITGIGENKGVQKYNATVSVPAWLPVSDYKPE